MAVARSATRNPAAPFALKGRLWIEIDGQPAMTEPGADLLEQIAVCGSVSEAARRLHFSYRRAWLIVDGMNRRWPAPLVTKAIGGKHGGGTRLTGLGQSILGSYRALQVQLEHLLDRSTASVARVIRSGED